jgi:hypothetical protein
MLLSSVGGVRAAVQACGDQLRNISLLSIIESAFPSRFSDGDPSKNARWQRHQFD